MVLIAIHLVHVGNVSQTILADLLCYARYIDVDPWV